MACFVLRVHMQHERDEGACSLTSIAKPQLCGCCRRFSPTSSLTSLTRPPKHAWHGRRCCMRPCQRSSARTPTQTRHRRAADTLHAPARPSSTMLLAPTATSLLRRCLHLRPCHLQRRSRSSRPLSLPWKMDPHVRCWPNESACTEPGSSQLVPCLRCYTDPLLKVFVRVDFSSFMWSICWQNPTVAIIARSRIWSHAFPEEVTQTSASGWTSVVWRSDLAPFFSLFRSMVFILATSSWLTWLLSFILHECRHDWSLTMWAKLT
jgi:hypothetical protein